MVCGEHFSAHVAAAADPGDAITAAIKSARSFAGKTALDDRLAGRLLVIVEELVSNTLHHGRQGRNVSLHLNLHAIADGVVLEIVDDAVAFDPLRSAPFTGPDSESGGGVGLELVRAWASDPVYLRDGDRNRLSMRLE